MKFHYYVPTRIFFGKGSVEKLSKIRLPGERALLITGGTSTTKLGYVDKIRNLLSDRGIGCEVYDGVVPNPDVETVHQCASLVRQYGCGFIIGLGGGSSIDTAKAAAVEAANPGVYWDYVFGGSGGRKKAEHPPVPVVAVPTTAGTGTEADPWAVITNGEEKIGYGSDQMFPDIAIVDPDFMMSVPANMTAYQGFDALFHAVEGYIAKTANPMSEMFAEKSIALLGEGLVPAVRNRQDREARASVALASTLAGFVESLSACASQHGIEHAMSALYPDLPHGAGLLMLSVEYFKLFQAVCGERFVKMARLLGRKDADKPEDFVSVLAEMQAACGVSALQMSKYGIKREDLPRIADNALTVSPGFFKVDARPLSREDVLGLLERVYQ